MIIIPSVTILFILLLIFNYTSYTYEYILYKIRNISDKTTVPFDPFYNPECPGTAQR